MKLIKVTSTVGYPVFLSAGTSVPAKGKGSLTCSPEKWQRLRDTNASITGMINSGQIEVAEHDGTAASAKRAAPETAAADAAPESKDVDQTDEGVSGDEVVDKPKRSKK